MLLSIQQITGLGIDCDSNYINIQTCMTSVMTMNERSMNEFYLLFVGPTQHEVEKKAFRNIKCLTGPESMQCVPELLFNMIK